MNRTSDQQRLEAYAREQDETAFSKLVDAYAGMVYATAYRRTGQVEAAREISQTAFAILARKAETLINHTSIGAWLHRTTVLESKKHLRAEYRHQRKMKAFTEEPTPAPNRDQAWERISSVLDEAIEKLSAKDREVVLLRFIEDLDFKEIKDRLGSTEAACRKRLERALGKLHGLLSQQGSTLTIAAITSGLGAQLSKAAPPTLMQGLCQSALSTATQTTNLNLLNSTLAIMSTSKAITITGVVALAMVPIGLQWKEIRNLKSQLRSQTEQIQTMQAPRTLTATPESPSSSSSPPSTSIIANSPRNVGQDDSEAFRDKMLRAMDDGANQMSEEERLEFWESVRNGPELDKLIGNLQAAIETNPEDTESRLVLAQAYIAKVWGSSSGSPEQGLWAGKAEAMWKGVLEIEPDNWRAQRNIAFSYSQYPDFTNKTPEAIQEYEKTVALQEAAQNVGTGFDRTYLDLAKLHLKNGDPSNALATLEKGANLHPDSSAIAEQLKVITSSYKFE